MKRNNIFMWAYISFIIICICLRFFSDYLLWSPIVLAITISSMFFAIEDLFSSLFRFLDNLCNIAENFILNSKDKISRDLATLSKMEQKVVQYEGSLIELFSLTDWIKQIHYTGEKLHESKKWIDESQSQYLKRRKIQDKLKIFANLFAYLGFLALFCVLVIATFVDIPVILQDYFTVLSFAIILSTQQIALIASEKNAKDSKNSKDALRSYEKTHLILHEIEREFDEIVENADEILHLGSGNSKLTSQATE